jgi:hypothetical protein
MMAKTLDPNRMPTVGESLFLRTTSLYSSPHCHALYLGEDDTGGKVLLPTYTDGFSIVNFESIDPNAYRASGRFNIRSEAFDNGVAMAYDYIFFDVGGSQVKEMLVRVRRIEGRWIIVSRPENPSWSE